MGQIDIGHLYRILFEHRRLDPEVARGLLQRILKALREMKGDRVKDHPAEKKESVENGDEML